MPELLGAKLRYLREQKKLTQSELAALLGLRAHSHVAKIEAGQDNPSLTLIVEISHVFKVSSDYLLRDPISVSAVEFRKEMQGDSTAGLASHFGRQLRRLRSEASMSQQTLAAHLGLRNHTHIANLEAGRKLPSIDLVLAVANLFSLSIDALLVQGDSPKEHL